VITVEPNPQAPIMGRVKPQAHALLETSPAPASDAAGQDLFPSCGAHANMQPPQTRGRLGGSLVKIFTVILLFGLHAFLATCSGGSNSTSSSGGIGDEQEIPGRATPGALAQGSTSRGRALDLVRESFNVAIRQNPTVNVESTAQANAAAIAARIGEQIAACATASVTHIQNSSTVIVDFGTGCPVAESGVTLSGQFTVTVASAVATDGGISVTVTLAFTNLAASGTSTAGPISGSAEATTSDGRTYRLAGDVTGATTGHVVFDIRTVLDAVPMGVDAGGRQFGFTLSGVLTATPSDAPDASPGNTTLTGLHHAVAKCYFDQGTLQNTQAETVTVRGQSISRVTTSTVTFLPTTPVDGKVSVTVNYSIAGASLQDGGVGMAITLPATDRCPQTADAGS
jgi:hypothetical protein